MEFVELRNNILNQDLLTNFFVEVNNYFIPTLSHRILNKSDGVTDFSEYSKKVLKLAKCLVILENNQINGIVIIYTNDSINKKSYIPILAVKKESQGKGYSKKLMGKAIEKARLEGMKEVIVKTWSENKIAIKIYERLGFSVIEERGNGISLKLKI
jgi:ribosomal protein S18 acetylase RimI-like enzyme